MDDLERLDTACHTIGTLLQHLAEVRARGAISEETFVELVLKVEAEQLAPQGFNLTVSDTANGWMVFQIRAVGVADACAAFEYLPETGEFRRSCGSEEAEGAAKLTGR